MSDRPESSSTRWISAWRRCLTIALALSAHLAVETDTAWAQETARAAAGQWKEDRPPEPRNGRVEAPRMLRSGEITDQKLFDDYWKYYLSQLTWSEAQNDYHDFRYKIRLALRGASGNAAHQRITREIILPYCLQIAKSDEYSPQSRINALLLIGELNEKEANAAGAGAVALAQARPALLHFLDPKLPVDDLHDALRVTALVGLETHLERGGIKEDRERRQVIEFLQTLLKDKDPPAGRAPLVHKWLQSRANSLRSSLGGGTVARGG